MAAIVRGGDAPQFDEPHLLARISSLEELDLGGEEGGDIYTMSGKDDVGCEGVRGRRRDGSGLLWRSNVGGVMVVLGDGVGNLLRGSRRLLDCRSWSWSLVWGILEGEVAREEGSELIL